MNDDDVCKCCGCTSEQRIASFFLQRKQTMVVVPSTKESPYVSYRPRVRHVILLEDSLE